MEFKFFQVLSVSLLSFLVFACAPASHNFQDSQGEVLEDIAESEMQEKPEVPSSTIEVVLRSRWVRVNLSPLKALYSQKLRGEASGEKPQLQIRLNLFDDLSVDLNVHSLEGDEENLILSGKILGDPDSHFTLVSREQALVGHLSFRGRKIDLIDTPKGLQMVREFIDGAELTCGTNEFDAQAEPIELDELSEYDEVSLFAASTIDMLVMYTPSAVAAAGSKRALEAAIQAAAADTNTAFNEGKVGGHKVRVVAIVETQERDTGSIETDLSRLKGTNDGKWDNVHSLRSHYGADQVTLVIGAGDLTAGMGYIGGGKSRAFTVIRYGAFKQQTFAHELGHNLGLQHADGIEIAGQFRTIMAYGSTQRVPRFSSPESSYKGYVIGDRRRDSVAKLKKSITPFSKLLSTKVR